MVLLLSKFLEQFFPAESLVRPEDRHTGPPRFDA
jgi:hypothetical protein